MANDEKKEIQHYIKNEIIL